MKLQKSMQIGIMVAILSAFAFVHQVGALTPAERKIALHAKAQLEEGKQQLKTAQDEAAAAQQEAAGAWSHAAETDLNAVNLQKQIDASHANEERLGKENARLLPIEAKFKQLSGHWGINAILFGFGVLAKHILIMIAVLVVLAVLLGVASFVLKATFPWLAPIASLLEGLWAKLLAIFTPKPKS